jgi:hypothetical protein
MADFNPRGRSHHDLYLGGSRGTFCLARQLVQFPALAITLGLIWLISNNIFNDFTDFVRRGQDNYYRNIYGAGGRQRR